MLITATKYNLSPDSFDAGTRKSYGIEKLEFIFSDDWDGLDISVTFHPQRGRAIRIPYLGGEIDIPWEEMRYSGESEFVLSGTKTDGDALEKQIVSLTGKVIVHNTRDADGGNTGKVSPDTYDLFLSEAKRSIGECIDEALTQAKESGEFRGEPGDPFEYEDFTQEQLDALRGEPGRSGVFVKEDSEDEPDDEDNIMVDMTFDEDDEIIQIPDSLLREGDRVYLMCEDEKIGDPFEIKDGKDGKDGTNFKILGYYGTVELLRTAVTDPGVGDAYGIGTQAPYNVYVFDGVTLDWVDNGSLAGVAGADGVGIESIEQTTVRTESGEINVVTITLTDKRTYTFEIRNGAKGDVPVIAIGEVVTGDAETDASASIITEGTEYKINLVIPRGRDGSDAGITVDDEMSDDSENAVQNKVIKAYVDDLIGDVDAALEEINGILGGENT